MAFQHGCAMAVCMLETPRFPPRAGLQAVTRADPSPREVRALGPACGGRCLSDPMPQQPGGLHQNRLRAGRARPCRVLSENTASFPENGCRHFPYVGEVLACLEKGDF